MNNPEFSRRRLIGAGLAGAFGLTAGLAIASARAAANKQVIKLGFIGPLSGGNAQQGLGARNGFLLALEQANAGDYPFALEGVVHDDASDPQTGVGAALKLVNDPDVVAAIGHWNSSVALATIPVFHRFQTPFIVWGAISPAITDQNLPEVTRVTPTLITENQPLARWMATDLGVKNVAIVADTSDYGTANAKAFQAFAQDNGATVASTDLYPVGTTDFRSVLTKIKGNGADGIYFGGVITDAGIFRKQQRELGIDLPMAGTSGIYDPEFIALAGEAAEGVMVSYPAGQTNPALDKLEADYQARAFAEPASPYTKYAYEATNILLAAIKDIGVQDKVALAKAIRGISYTGVLGTTTFDSNGQTQVPVEVEIKIVKDGQWVARD